MSGLASGEWFYFRVENDRLIIPPIVNVYTLSWEHRMVARRIRKMEAIALWRWHYDAPVYYSVKDGNGRFFDIRVAGDVDAFHGNEDNAR